MVCQARYIGEHVILEGVAVKSQQDEVTQSIVVGRHRIEDDRNKGANILNRRSLGVEIGDGGRFIGGGGINITVIVVMDRATAIQWRRRSTGRGSLTFEGCSDGALLIEGPRARWTRSSASTTAHDAVITASSTTAFSLAARAAVASRS